MPIPPSKANPFDAGNNDCEVVLDQLFQAYSWTADYVTVTGNLCDDLLINIASEQRVKVVCEYLYHQINVKMVREAIDFLLIRGGIPQPYVPG